MDNYRRGITVQNIVQIMQQKIVGYRQKGERTYDRLINARTVKGTI